MAIDVRLRQVALEDLPIFFGHQQDPEAVEMAAFPSRDRAAFDAHWARLLADETSIVRTIVAAGRVAGYVGCYGPASAREVCYWLGREFWGRGVAAAALGALLQEVPARPLHAHVAKHNRRSCRVLVQCGFEVVGESRGPAPTGGEAVDEVLFRLG